MNRTLRKATGLLPALAALAILAAALLLASGIIPLHLYAVSSDSMSPGLPVKSVVVVDTEQGHAVGDVITFRLGDSAVTHRLTEIENDGTYVTKGDNVEDVDPFTVTEANVVGPVVASAPELGYWLVFLQQPAGLGAVIFGAFAVWMLFSAANDIDEPADSATDGDEPDDRAADDPAALPVPA